jgi:hypothetical protein
MELGGSGGCVLLMLVYPPYIQMMYSRGTYGYAWIFELPHRATVNLGTLVIQWVGVLIAGGIAHFVLKDKT